MMTKGDYWFLGPRISFEVLWFIQYVYEVFLFQTEHNRHTEPAADILAFVFGRNPRLSQTYDTNCFIRKTIIRCAYNFKVCEATVPFHHKRDNNTSLNAVGYSSFWVVHFKGDISVQSADITMI